MPRALPAVPVLVLIGLGSSTLHLASPAKARRALSQWRTSWLSREVIVLPLFMASCAAWSIAHALNLPGSVVLGVWATLVCVVLFVCTAMIYASLKFLHHKAIGNCIHTR